MTFSPQDLHLTPRSRLGQDKESALLLFVSVEKVESQDPKLKVGRPRFLFSVTSERQHALGKAHGLFETVVSILEKRETVLLLPAEELLGQNMILKMPEGYSNVSVVVNPYPIHTKVRAKKENPWGPAICLFWGLRKPASGCSGEQMQPGATVSVLSAN